MHTNNTHTNQTLDMKNGLRSGRVTLLAGLALFLSFSEFFVVCWLSPSCTGQTSYTLFKVPICKTLQLKVTNIDVFVYIYSYCITM